MPTSVVDSLIFRDVFGSPAMREIWSDEFRTQKYLDWEAALARAEAKVGIIPQGAADEINRVCKVENIDFEKYAKETLTIGYPVLGLVHQIAHLCRGDAGKYCHWGATTQDITDSATILQIKASFDLIAKDLDRAIAATGKFAREHRSTPMPARSNLQQAVPITFGFKMARLLATLKRHRTRLAEIRPRIEVFEFGGAAGTLATLGDKGLAVQEALARELSLAQPENRLAHRARPYRGGRLLPRACHRHACQVRHRPQADDADRGQRGERALCRQPRLVLDHATEAQPDLVLLYPRLRRIGAAGGGGTP
jgi:3-carboxy-cis,cis-muconate cycloisomerase